MVVKIVSLTRSGGSMVIAVPRDVRELLGLKHGDELLLGVQGEQIILQKFEDRDVLKMWRAHGHDAQELEGDK